MTTLAILAALFLLIVALSVVCGAAALWASGLIEHEPNHEHDTMPAPPLQREVEQMRRTGVI